ncbi:hypothetical protein [Halosolutus halophilus]|uniref:hypothetical protein n=1 Tax=Halosolutus halophilus TaxID=1552990 RepID=UPI0022352430|nr:hypothetical protein [Halosolutus halophilus]
MSSDRDDLPRRTVLGSVAGFGLLTVPDVHAGSGTPASRIGADYAPNVDRSTASRSTVGTDLLPAARSTPPTGPIFETGGSDLLNVR